MKKVIAAAVIGLLCAETALAQTDPREERRKERQEQRQQQKQQAQGQRQEQRQEQRQQRQEQRQQQAPAQRQQQRQQPQFQPQQRPQQQQRPQIQQERRQQRQELRQPQQQPPQTGQRSRPDAQPAPARQDLREQRRELRQERREGRQDNRQDNRAQRRDDRQRPNAPQRPRADRPARQADGVQRQRPPRPATQRPRARQELPTNPRARRDRADRPAARSPRRFDQARSQQARQRAAQRARNQQARRSYRQAGRTRWVYRAPRYAYPRGYRYRVFRRGHRFPTALFLTAWFLNDFAFYNLAPPPYGYRWVRYGPDAVLVNTTTYEIADTDYGVFHSGAPDGYVQDQQDLPAIDPELPQEFLTGELDLGDSSGPCGDLFEGSAGDAMLDAWRDEDWNGVASEVVAQQCPSNVSYFLLGLAAEGLVLPDAAAAYYQRAIEISDGDDDDLRCEAWNDDACFGLDVAEEAAQGLERLYGPAEDEEQ